MFDDVMLSQIYKINFRNETSKRKQIVAELLHAVISLKITSQVLPSKEYSTSNILVASADKKLV